MSWPSRTASRTSSCTREPNSPGTSNSPIPAPASPWPARAWRSPAAVGASSDLAEAERLVTTIKDPQYMSYCHWGRAWAALTHGRLAEARQEAASAAEVTAYFASITLPLAAPAALWAGDVADGKG